MIFTSLTFLVFLVIVYLLYWGLERRGQNLLLLVASYVFYGWWDWRFLFLILFSSTIDYAVGIRIAGSRVPRHRQLWLSVSMTTNLALLGFFKYYNFFAESFRELLAQFGVQAGPATLHIILPIGISFYTFQALSYTIDVYRGKCHIDRNIVNFLAFVGFFPQLVAGPIQRASHLLGQFGVARHFDLAEAKDGLRQMLWGFFKKIVIADGLAAYVNATFVPDCGVSGSRLLLGLYFFAFQIYCDFSAYSDIAAGCAKLFGFRLSRNFNYPYFARDIREFWQRWHMSLSTWFRDYVYIPLGGSKVPLRWVVFNILVTFTVSGFWHGANWTFLIWGFLNGLYFLPGLLRRHSGRHTAPTPDATGSWRDLLAILITFHLVLVGWLFFRAANLTQVGQIVATIWSQFDIGFFLRDAVKLKLLLGLLLAAEWCQRHRQHPLEIQAWPVWARWGAYQILIFAILMLGTFDYQPFIYFQF